MHRLVEIVKRNLPGGRGVVAVSGGADSVALLRACHELKVDVTVAHVNHQLRGAESDEDQEFVSSLAATLNLPFVSTRIALPSVGIEAAARTARYHWFNTLEGDWIATGHTADDQAETVLFRIIRGTGLAGLRGMSAQSPPVATGWLELIRPLLEVTRADVIDYLTSMHQPYRDDSSNADPRFTRNRIRHELIPLLKTFNPDLVAAVNRLADQCADAVNVLRIEAVKLLEKAERPRAGNLVILDRAGFESAHAYLVSGMFRVLWEREGWPQDRMTARNWSSIDGDLPGGVTARRVGPVMQIGRTTP